MKDFISPCETGQQAGLQPQTEEPGFPSSWPRQPPGHPEEENINIKLFPGNTRDQTDLIVGDGRVNIGVG